MKILKPLHLLGIILTSFYLIFILLLWKIQEYELAKFSFVLIPIGGLSIFAWPIIAPKYSRALGVEPYRGKFASIFAFATIFAMMVIGLSSIAFIDKNLVTNNYHWVLLVSLVVAVWVAIDNKRQMY